MRIYGRTYRAFSRRIAVPRGTDDLETELQLWIEQLKTIDAVLQGPIMTLLRLGERCIAPTTDDGAAGSTGRFPGWVSEKRSSQNSSNLVHALCCSTLQRVARIARRWPWPEKTFAIPLAALVERLPETLAARSSDPAATLQLFEDAVFRPLNPLLSAEIFWVYLNAGETWAHGGPGFVAAFGMLWAIHAAQEATRRSSGDPRAMATTILSKCLMPLKRLEATIHLRSRLYRDIVALCKELDESCESTDTHQRWRFASRLDQLSSVLAETSNVAIHPVSFQRAAAEAAKTAGTMTPGESGARWPEVCALLRDAIIQIGEETANVLTSACTVIDYLETDVVAKLGSEATSQAFKTELRPRIAGEDQDQYRDRIENSARVALRSCRSAVDSLQNVVEVCDAFSKQTPANPPNAETIRATLETLAAINDSVADVVRQAVTPAVQSCRRVVRQEVAYASAGNDTDFDAGDLLSAIAVSERWDQISQLEVEDAIVKALRAARPDGSWTTGQPIYLRKRVLGVWPGTSDLGWLLATAIRGEPRIRIADEALLAFVQWLVRNQTTVDYRPDDRTRIRLQGWPVERRETTTIDLWTTASAIHALLDIRDIVEHRLWELCERRFLVVTSVRGLDKIDPVDLGARHDRRLHYRLRKAARDMRGRDWRAAEYSFVLHGPPGSSKTAVAEALGREMAGRSEPRIVRITPADFTRRGEPGVDAEARFIFDLLTRVRRVTIMFDEIDDLLRRRELKGVPAFLKMVVPAMLNRLQDLRDAAPRQEIASIIAMNYIDNVEPALVRPGRIDGAVPVVYPDAWSRENTLLRIIEEEAPTLRLPKSIRSVIIDRTADWPWTTYQKLCKKIVAQHEDVTDEGIGSEVARLRSELQNLGAAYCARTRWIPECPQLVDEVAHLLLSHGRTASECRDFIDKLFAGSGGRIEKWTKHVGERIAKQFDAIWQDDMREAAAASESPIPEMGAEFVAADTDTVAFTIWAPDVTAVAVQFANEANELPLVYREPGVWSAARQRIGPETQYRFSIVTPHKKRPDGSDAVVEKQDPLARDITPDGTYSIYRQRRIVSDFDCPGYHELLIYQIDVPSYGLVKNGRYDHLNDAALSFLQEFGVNAIDLISPTEDPRANDETYDPAATRKREHDLGGVEELVQLVARAHAHDIAVIIGVTTKYLLGRGIVDLRRFTGHEYGMGIYFDDDERASTQYGPRPAFGRREVSNLMVENARRWFEEVGVDGLRWGGLHFVRHVTGKDERTGSLDTGWRLMRRVNDEVARQVRKASPPHHVKRTITIAEDASEPGRLVSRSAHDSARFGAQWSRSYTYALRHAITDPTVANVRLLKNAIGTNYSSDVFTRVVSVESRESLRRQSRLTRLLRDKGVDDETVARRCLLAVATIIVTPGIPMFLQGTEKFADEVSVKRLMQLRRNFVPNVTLGLTGHNWYVSHDEATNVLAVHRWYRGRSDPDSGDEVVTFLNFSGKALKYTADFPYPGRWTVRFSSKPEFGDGASVTAAPIGTRSSAASIDLPPYGVAMFSQDV
jgi:1,4-alpha-glucan branching enzyme